MLRQSVLKTKSHMMGTTYIYVVQALYTLSDIGLQKSLLVSDNSHSSIPVATLPHVWAVN
jgi:hypothetical protein